MNSMTETNFIPKKIYIYRIECIYTTENNGTEL